MNRFPEKKKGDALAASHVNDLGKAITSMEGMRASNAAFMTSTKSLVMPAQHIEGLATITNAKIDENDSLYSGLYLCKFRSFRRYDEGESTPKWKDDDSDYILDLRGLSDTYRPQHDLFLMEKEVVSCWYDASSSYLVPSEVPRIRRVISQGSILPGTMGLVSVPYGPVETAAGSPIPEIFVYVLHSGAAIGPLQQFKIYYDESLSTWVPLDGGSGGSETRIKFRALADINNRTLAVTVLHSTTVAAPVYSLMNIFDPNNLWGTATRGCVGFASYNLRRSQWEIESCSLPANEVLVFIEDELKAFGTPPTGTVVAEWGLRSTYPNVMRPPSCDIDCEYTWNRSLSVWELTTPCGDGCTCTGPPEDPPADPTLEGQTASGVCLNDSGAIVLTFTNPQKLDAVCDSNVILRRVSNAGFGSPFEDAPAVDGSATDFRWEVVAVEKKHARWITFVYTEEEEASVVVLSYCDGEDPGECGNVLVDYPHGEPCPGDLVSAYYCPNSNTYKAVITDSAMMGTPINEPMITVLAPDSCGLEVSKENFRMFRTLCEAEEPTVTKLKLGTSTPVLVSVGAGECGEISYAYQNIRAFLCDTEGEPTSPGFSDFMINLGDAKFLTGAAFGGNTNCGSATWQFRSSEGEWVEVTPCPAGCTSSGPPETTPSTAGGSYQWNGTTWVVFLDCDGVGGVLDPPPDREGTPDEVVDVDCVYTATTPCSVSEGASCGLNLTFKTLAEICDGSPGGGTVTHVPLQLTAIDVVTDVAEGLEGIIVEHAVAYVCSWEATDDSLIPFTPCPAPSPCSGYATYRWNNSIPDWELLTPCPEGCTSTPPADDPVDPEGEVPDVDVPCTEVT